MIRTKIKVYLPPLLLALASIASEILSETNVLDAAIASLVVEEKVEFVESLVKVITYIAFVVPLACQSVVRGERASLCDKTIEKYIDDKRDVLASILHDHQCITGPPEVFNIRIFKKKHGRLVLENDAVQSPKRIEGKLSFNISKDEGLCVKAYKENKSMLEIEDASKAEYNLTQRQQALAGGLKFIVAVPIQQDNASKTDYVICFDSFQKIAQPGCKEDILRYCENIAYSIASIME